MPARLEPQSWEFSGVPYIIGGDGSEIPTGYDGAFYVRQPRVIRGWHMVGPPDESGSIDVSLRACTYASYPSVVEILTPSIAGGTKNDSTEPPAAGPVSVALPADTWVTVYVVSSSGFAKWVALTLDWQEGP